MLGSLLVSLLIGVPAGIIAARNRGRWLDRAATLVSSFGVAVPSFVVGLWLIVIFAAWLDVVPFAGYVAFGESPVEWAKRMILPILALSGVMIAELMRQIRAALVDTLDTDSSAPRVPRACASAPSSTSTACASPRRRRCP